MTNELRTVVTDRASATDIHLSKTIIVALSPLRIVVTRALRVYVQTLAGLLTSFLTGAAGALGVEIGATDFWHLLLKCASLAVAPAAMSALMNIGELLAKLDESKPQLRA